MTPCTIPPISATLRLQRAQAMHVALDKGVVVQVLAGRVRLHEPLRWLGGCATASAVTLCEGEGHRLAQGGWVRIEALNGEALVQQQAPAPTGQLALVALKRGLRWWGGWLRRPTLAQRSEPFR